MVTTPRANYPNLAVSKALISICLSISTYINTLTIFRVTREAEWKKMHASGNPCHYKSITLY